MNVSILVCTYGEDKWRRLAADRALPSARRQKDALEIRGYHMAASEMPGAVQPTLAQVRNAAAELAQGDWLCFLDADDELALGYLGAMNEAHRRRTGNELVPSEIAGALYYPAVQYVYGNERADPPVLLAQNRPLVELNRAVIATLVPRDLFLELGGFRDLPALEDWELWLRCSRHVPLVAVPEAVYRVHVRARSRNADQSLYRQIRAEHEAGGV